jgi:Transcriptional Coactivator p15 (PC4)
MHETDRQILPKNAVEPSRIAPCEYHGHAFVDIRVYFQDDAGEWRPSKKGVTVSLDLWADFKDAITLVEVPRTERRARRRAQAVTR